MPIGPERIAGLRIYQIMAASDADKAARLYAMASNFRHVAEEAGLPGYRARLLSVARDLEREAARLDDQAGPQRPPGTSSRAR